MNRKIKKSFSLIETVIAILLAAFACTFLLQFESSLITRAQHSVNKLEAQRAKQEAFVRLFDELYQNHIPWKSILEGKSYTLDLLHPGWSATYSFTPQRVPQTIEPDIMDVQVQLDLTHGEHEYEKVASVRLCLKKEVGSNAIKKEP